ncbi:MAG: efflux RND transporter periplasmic adaptor subunit [Gammaproteobacteria bacterium]|nr:efflux RND transporter periplasmic adaptor subunit [Gammaproteobacteria bacterium]NIR97693.1 efflux RND transporter periplasmic adaptor subunit [Gammaproteobacteria bacterium]NIT62886.1 efflux RND transporter periplasmic adaptor subunit [Gammaproteobacteria bacterium]NIV19851.1 efflux RND transporter periplasmic adaptor subunit [Gammaproteobacteria bacterium]NIX11364.1 efflux RND transporter periplasmic adaptor subunit [Gammaproteobacteria bacterium]
MAHNRNDAPSDIHRVFGPGSRASSGRRLLKPLGAAVSLLLVVAIAVYIAWPEGAGVRYEFAEARRGALTVSVTTTGVLEPVNQVEVGTEISGTVETVEADFNDRVQVGQVLARLDTDQLEARLRQSQAALALAKAAVNEAEATVLETRNRLRRARELEKKGLCSQEECDAAQAAYARARASLARAQVLQAQAQVDAERTTLDKAVIRSPIDGIVLQRQIEPGQTVAASLLFTLAESLAQMELHVAVDEADVGQVREGQQATFTVDAYPERTYPAVITEVRYAPQTIERVVTYGTVLSVDNADLSLRPGMTATADIIVNEIDDALLVPNAALRFVPPERAVETDGGLVSRLLPRRPRDTSRDKRKDLAGGAARQRVWTLRDGEPVAIPVRVGATDGQVTEVLSGDVQAGQSLQADVLSAGR